MTDGAPSARPGNGEITAREAARLVGVSKRAILLRCAEGTLPCRQEPDPLKPGGYVYWIPRAELQRVYPPGRQRGRRENSGISEGASVA
jgi:hypothetical protein